MYSIDELSKAHNYAIQRYISKNYHIWFVAFVIPYLSRSFYNFWHSIFSFPWFIIMDIVTIVIVVLEVFASNLKWLKVKKIVGFGLAGLFIFLIVFYWKNMDLFDRWMMLCFCIVFVCVNSYKLWKMKDYIYESVSKKGLSKELLKVAKDNIETLMDYSTDYYSHDKLVKYNLSDDEKLKGSILLEPDYAISRINHTNQIAIIPKDNIDLSISEFNGKKTIKLPLADSLLQIYLKDDEYSKLSKWKTAVK